MGASISPSICAELTQIIANRDAVVVSCKEDATHIVEWDSDVDNAAPEVLGEEEYIRTLELKTNSRNLFSNDAENVSDELQDPFQDGSALVHWWYHPDSYDECIPYVDVEMPEGNYENQIGAWWEDSIWRVCCRYIRDVEIFNEWGNELDYEMDYEKESNTGGGMLTKSMGNSAPGRGRGRQGRSKRKFTQPSEEKSVPSKKKVESYSPVLEASTVTEKAVSHLIPVSCTTGNNSANYSYAVLDVQLASSTALSAHDDNQHEPLVSDCKLNSELPSSFIRDTEPGRPVSGQSKVSSEPEFKRRRLGQIRHPYCIELSAVGADTDKSVSKFDQKLPESAPAWFNPNSISSTEVRYLPEFFDGSSSLRDVNSYQSLRNFMLNLYWQNSNAYLSATECRKRMCGDAGAIIRVHAFLDTFGIINYAVPTDARPPIYPFQSLNPLVGVGTFSKLQNLPTITSGTKNNNPKGNAWSEQNDTALMKAVVQYGHDWQAVGFAMGIGQNSSSGINVEDCVVRFVQLTDGNITSSADERSVGTSSIGGTVPTDLSSTFHGTKLLQSLINEYVASRLSALEEKVLIIYLLPTLCSLL